VIQIQDFTLDEISLIMDTAARFETALASGGRLLNMAGKSLATLFYEPSTRTRLSFERAVSSWAGR
jgi:aspartate carbamoyltransferase catalytic subunit